MNQSPKPILSDASFVGGRGDNVISSKPNIQPLSDYTERFLNGTQTPTLDQISIDAIRSRELYRYIDPDYLTNPSKERRGCLPGDTDEHMPSLAAALRPFCRFVALRTNAQKCMLNFMDRDSMYFLSEASRPFDKAAHEFVKYSFVDDALLPAGLIMPLRGRICEMAVQMERGSFQAPPPYYVLPDLTHSPFSEMDIVTESPKYRFYAATPITTRNCVNIGILAIMDTVTRPGLTKEEEDFLAETSDQIMSYLETNRQALEGLRFRRMGRGLESFISGKSSIYDAEANAESISAIVSSKIPGDNLSKSHETTFKRAANLIHESLGKLGEDGGVYILSLGSLRDQVGKQNLETATKSGATKPEGVASRRKGYQKYSRNSSILAASTSNGLTTPRDQKLGNLRHITDEVLRELLRRNLSGQVWLFDEASQYTCSAAQAARAAAPQPDTSAAHRATFGSEHNEKAVKAAFPNAQQVLFAPVRDWATGSAIHAVFVAATLETNPLSHSPELSWVTSFCNTLTQECNRVETLFIEKQKSDFVSTMSHEMRSPLHGILGSAELLEETKLDGVQNSLVRSVSACGATLLDTINNILEYSKINEFKKKIQSMGRRNSDDAGIIDGPVVRKNSVDTLVSHAPPILALSDEIDVSMVLEEVVDGLVLGHAYKSVHDLAGGSVKQRRQADLSNSPVAEPPVEKVRVVLDLDFEDWNFVTQPGAVRRIIMNITGNSLKYTAAGSITVHLELLRAQDSQNDTETVQITVRDTGKGMSQQYLSAQLFTPFAQENPLTPGTGLGLSIVHSIVSMLDGTIDIQSEVGKGTTVQVALPMTRLATRSRKDRNGSNAIPHREKDESVSSLRDQKVITEGLFFIPEEIPDEHARNITNELKSILEDYFQDWYGLDLKTSNTISAGQVILVEEEYLPTLLEQVVKTGSQPGAVVLLCGISRIQDEAYSSTINQQIGCHIEFVSKPIGPHRLARGMFLAIQKLKSSTAEVNTEAMDLDSETGKNKNLSTAIKRNIGDILETTPDETRKRPRLTHEETADTKHSKDLSQTNGDSTAIEAGVQPRILLVDDNQINLMLLQTFLKSKRQYRSIQVAYNGREAVDIYTMASLRKKPVDLIFMDISMPVMNGFEATREIRRFEGSNDAFVLSQQDTDGSDHAAEPCRPAKIVALTGLASAKDQEEVYESGCDIYMTKPVSLKEVGKFLDRWEEQRKQGSDGNQR